MKDYGSNKESKSNKCNYKICKSKVVQSKYASKTKLKVQAYFVILYSIQNLHIHDTSWIKDSSLEWSHDIWIIFFKILQIRKNDQEWVLLFMLFKKISIKFGSLCGLLLFLFSILWTLYALTTNIFYCCLDKQEL